MDRKFYYPMRVRYSEVDAMRVVHNSRYQIFFEEARTEMLRQGGYSYDKLENDGVMLPLSQVVVNYKRPLVYDEKFTVEVWVEDVTRVKGKICYRILKEDGTVACDGHTMHASVKRETMRPVRMPAHFREILLKFQVLPELIQSSSGSVNSSNSSSSSISSTSSASSV